MKKFYLILLCATFISIQFGCKKNDDNTNIPDTITDSRDGQVYATLTIGDQTWFSQNLNYETSNSVRNYDTEEWWWYNNDPNNGKIYGRLYTWNAALTSCPDGWHLPSNNEWATLLISLGVSQSELIEEGWVGTDEGKKMKSTSHWIGEGNGTNTSNFNGLPGGTFGNGEFLGLGESGFWWSSSNYGAESAYEYDLSQFDDRVYFGHFTKTFGRSVRCIKDK